MRMNWELIKQFHVNTKSESAFIWCEKDLWRSNFSQTVAPPVCTQLVFSWYRLPKGPVFSLGYATPLPDVAHTIHNGLYIQYYLYKRRGVKERCVQTAPFCSHSPRINYSLSDLERIIFQKRPRTIFVPNYFVYFTYFGCVQNLGRWWTVSLESIVMIGLLWSKFHTNIFCDDDMIWTTPQTTKSVFCLTCCA